MKKHLFTLCALLMALSVSAQDMSGAKLVHKIWDNNTAPHSNGMAVAGETRNSRPTLTTEAILYVYTPNPAAKNGRGVVICPGGGYRHLSMENEGAHMAAWFAAHGYTAAVLHYRMPNGCPEVPLEDACEAISLLRGEKEGLPAEMHCAKVGIAGSSAGGHLAAMTSTMGSVRPDFSLLFYPVITAQEGKLHKGSFDNLLGEKRSKKLSQYYSLENRVTEQTPPALILYADDDRTVPSVNGPIYYEALKEHGIRSSLHIFPYGGHGFGMRDTFHYKHAWMPLMLDWIDTILK